MDGRLKHSKILVYPIPKACINKRFMTRSSRVAPDRIYALKIPLPVVKIPFFSAMDM
jgi:hypothetical protein